MGSLRAVCLTILVEITFHVHVAGSDITCGRPIGSVTFGKIVGGYDVGYYKYPWFVSFKNEGEVFCGGTLISSKFIVTAAHCYQPFFRAVRQGRTTLEEVLEPTFGVYNVCITEETQKTFEVAKVFVHEEYVEKDPYYDITLVQLKTPATEFLPCCLPPREISDKSRPREAIITGLGVMKFDADNTPCTVHEARVLMYGDDVCRKMLDDANSPGDDLEGAFCAGYLSGGIDACQGDSGGPLIVLGEESKFYLLGLTSFGFRCAAPNSLGIYTDVSHYLDWIHDTVEKGDTGTEPTKPPATQNPPKPGGSEDWSQYPATPWYPVKITVPPWQTLPPSFGEKPSHHTKKPDHNRPVIIIVNKHQKGKAHGTYYEHNHSKDQKHNVSGTNIDSHFKDNNNFISNKYKKRSSRIMYDKP